MSDKEHNQTRRRVFRAHKGEWAVRVSDSAGILSVDITNGGLQLQSWGSYRNMYPKNERQLLRAIRKAERVAAKMNEREANATRLKEWAEGLTDVE